MTRILRAVAAVSAALLLPVLGQQCQPLGPAFPAPTNLAADPLMRAAVANLTATLAAAAAGRLPGIPARPNAEYSSIGMLSARDTGDAATLFQHHYTPSGAAGGAANSTRRTDGNTIFRIASITKTFTVHALLLLQQAGRLSLEDPVTYWLWELAAPAGGISVAREPKVPQEPTVERVGWSEVTVGALASHLSGIARDFDQLPGFPPSAIAALGLPQHNSSQRPLCGPNPGQRPCSRREFLSGLSLQHPVLAPFRGPSYSNSAFGLLGLVIEAATDQPYKTVVEDLILKRLRLTRTSVGPPRDPSGNVVVADYALWNYDQRVQNPSGGIYSSLNDLLTYGGSILRHTLLSPARTRRWLKPWSFASASALREAVGAPWEIARLVIPSPTGGGPAARVVVDLYTKGGSQGNVYGSQLVLVPDYGLVLSGLLAVAAPPTPQGPSSAEAGAASNATFSSDAGEATATSTALSSDSASLQANATFVTAATDVSPTAPAAEATETPTTTTATATEAATPSTSPSATVASVSADTLAVVGAAGANLSAIDLLLPRIGLVLARLLPVAEQVARQQATANFAGLYTVSRSSESSSSAAAASAAENTTTTTATPSSLVRITVDAGPGLRMTEFRARGQDVLAQLGATFGSGGGGSSSSTLGIRLYPSGLESGAASSSSSSSASTGGGNRTAAVAPAKRVSFRALVRSEGRGAAAGGAVNATTTAPTAPTASATAAAAEGLPSAAAADDPEVACQGVWLGLDAVMYGNHALNEVIFHVGGPDGRAVRVELPAWQLVLNRVSEAES